MPTPAIPDGFEIESTPGGAAAPAIPEGFSIESTPAQPAPKRTAPRADAIPPLPRAPNHIPAGLQPDSPAPAGGSLGTIGMYGVPLPAPPPIDAAAIASGTARNLSSLLQATAPMVQANPEFGGQYGAAPPTPQQVQTFGQAAERPVVPLSEGARRGTLAHGILAGAESLTTPANAALVTGMTATGGVLGGLAVRLEGYPLVAVKGLNLSLSSYFTAQAAKGFAANTQAAYDAWQQGNYGAVAENLGLGSVNALFTAFGAAHVSSSVGDIAATKVPKLPEVPADRWSVGHSGGFTPPPPPEPAPGLNAAPETPAAPPPAAETPKAKTRRNAPPVPTAPAESALTQDAGAVGATLTPPPPPAEAATPAPVVPATPPIPEGFAVESTPAVEAAAPSRSAAPAPEPAPDVPRETSPAIPEGFAVESEPPIEGYPVVPESPKGDGHPPSGSPSSSIGEQSVATADEEHPLAPLFREYGDKPHEAIARLVAEQQGAAPSIWTNPNVPKGKIGLAWGVPGDPENDWRGGFGLSHIIAKHVEAQKDFKLEDLPDLVPKLLPVHTTNRNRLVMETPDHRAVVSLDWHGNEEHWIISTYEPRDRQPSSPEGPYGVSDAPAGGNLPAPQPPDDSPSRLSEAGADPQGSTPVPSIPEGFEIEKTPETAKQPHEMSLAEFKGTEQAFQEPKGSILATDLSQPDAFEALPEKSVKELRALATVLNSPIAGSKAKIIERMRAVWELRTKVKDADVNTLLQLPASELRSMVEVYDGFRGNKTQMAKGILAWRDKSRADAQNAVGGVNWVRAIQRAQGDGADVPASVLEEARRRYPGMFDAEDAALDETSVVPTEAIPEPVAVSETAPESGTIEADDAERGRGTERGDGGNDSPALGGASPADGGALQSAGDAVPEGEPSGDGRRGDVRSDAEAGPGARSGSGDRAGALDQSGVRDERPVSAGDLTLQSAGRDYRITEATGLGEGTARQKLAGNLDAIRIVKTLAAEGRDATAAEQRTLARYVGWGATELAQVFERYRREHAGVREELESLLTPEEYREAEASTKNAHYTSPQVVSAMWRGVERLGFQAGSSVIEPSMGTGNYFGLQPDSLLPARRTGVELDKITGAIAKALYPDSNVQISGFEKIALPNDFFDLAISNVPFGNYPVYDPKYKRNRVATQAIHNYFFVKSLDLVRPGGIVAFVTSRYTADAKDASLRKQLADKADLLGMIRLPNTAFKGNAGTQVVTDIIFLRKRAPGEERAGEAWTGTQSVPVAPSSSGITSTEVNEYYARHPEMMLGTLSVGRGMHSNEEQTLTGKLTPELLDGAIDKLPQGVFKEWKADTPAFAGEAFAQLGDEVKDGGYAVKDGVIVRREGNLYRPVDKLSKTAAERIKAMLPVRAAVRDVFRTQLENAPDKDIVAARKKLGQFYDAFVKMHGPISNAGNRAAFGSDPDYPVLSGALEKYDRITGQAEKTAFFTERTISKPTSPEHVDKASEALAVALNERGRLDWARMQELTGKTPDELRAELGGIVYQNPDGQKWETADDYLSGNVREKLALAEGAAAANPGYRRNVEALEKVQPRDLEPEEIKAGLGAHWIPADVVAQFVQQVLDLPRAKVHYSPTAAAWSVQVDQYAKSRVANTKTYGNDDYSGHELVDLALNGKSPRVYTGPSDKRVLDPKATAAAQALLETLKDKFREWIWEDAARAKELAAKYNRELNNLRLVEHDGAHLTLPGSNPAIQLRPHQKNVIWRAIKTGNTLLAHEVGAGKTWEMCGIAMESRRLGVAKKPMLVVPNHMADQVSQEFAQLYPAARILTIGKDDFAKQNRKRAVARITSGDWDAVIMRHISFEKIPVSDATYQAFIDSQIRDLKAALEEQTKEAGKDDKTVKEIQKAISRLEVKLQKRLARETKDDAVTFEELGVDMLLVDEAHAFKKLPIITRRTRVAGIPTGESNRATDMLMKTQYVSALNGGQRGVIFATGTPVTNTMAELYNMQRYLQPKALADAGVAHFDAWANTFGEVKRGVELDVSGKGFRENERFAKFINIPELLTMYRQVADVKTAEMMKLPRPELATGKPQPISAPETPELTAFIGSLIKRSELIRTGKVDKAVDNMLKVVSEGKKAALDLRLIDPNAPDHAASKVNKAVANILDIWKRTKKEKLTQLVFCDLSTPKAAKGKKAVPNSAEQSEGNEEDESAAVPMAAGERAGFSVYDDMKRKLIAAGIPSPEIAFIHDAGTDAEKQALFDKVNAGDVRVIFGSTEKMGVGTNIQRKMLALHHMDAPWRPADIKQRDGRIQRQGNSNKEVHIFQYLTEGSFDAYSWQLLENKAAFIGPILSGSLTVREMDDIGMVLPSAAEFKAMASGNPLIREKIGTDAELGRLDAQRANYRKQQNAVKSQLAELPGRIAATERSVASLQADVAALADFQGADFRMGKRSFSGDDARKDFAAALDKSLDSWRGPGEPQHIGQYKSFELWTAPSHFQGAYPGLTLRRGGSTYQANTNPENPLGTVQSLENVARNLAGRIPDKERALAEARKQQTELQTVLGKPWQHEAKYQAVVQKKAEIDAQLAESEAEKAAGAEDGSTAAAPVDAKPNDEGVKESGAQKQARELLEERAAAKPAAPASAATSLERNILGYLTRPRTVDAMTEYLLAMDEGYEEANAVLRSLINRGLAERQGDSFDRTAKGKEYLRSPAKSGGDHSVTLGSGLGALDPFVTKFLQQDVVPTLKQTGEVLKLAKDDVLKVFAPAARGAEAKATALAVRANAAELARSTDRARAALAVAAKYFDKQPAQDNYDFMDAVETGSAQANGQLDQVAAVMRQMLDTRREAIQKLGTGKLANWIDNYFPHLWEQNGKAKALFGPRRPLEGGKAFLKKRTIATIKDGLAAGLTPVSDNPVDLVLAKAHEMDKYLAAHRMLADMRDKGLLQFKRSTAPMPDGYAAIDDKVATVYGTPSHEGALQIEGHWVAPEPAARVLNNYLAPGLSERSGLFRAYLGAANLMNQAQLGFSAFHLAFTTMDVATSKLALGIYKMSKGDIAKGFADVAQVPLSPVANILRGDKLLKEWYAPGSQGGTVAALVDAVVEAGGRAHMDSFYQSQVTKKLVECFRQGNVLGAALRLPFAALEQAARPIMEYIVPRQKLGVFADLARYELERVGGDVDAAGLQAALQRAWDSVDNRMGQLVYDNLFWSKVAKDLAMASVRSVGWNVGTIRELAGSIPDAAKLASGQGDFTPRLSYAIALPLMAGLLGAVLYYLWHGKAPSKLKDYYFPTDAHGHRWSLPSYMKDVYAWSHDPVHTARGKVHPFAELLWEMLSNRDYFDKPIRNPHHSLVVQAEEAAKHIAMGFVPIQFQPQKHATPELAGEKRALGSIGVTPAPKSLDHPDRR